MTKYPPTPSLKDDNFILGKFEYIKNKSDQEIFYTAYVAITITELWDYIKQYENFSDPEFNIIYNKIIELGYNGHSGCSFMATMREMQFISKYGEKEFKERYDNNHKRKI
jgi:hypothetical protein